MVFPNVPVSVVVAGVPWFPLNVRVMVAGRGVGVGVGVGVAFACHLAK